MKKITCCLCRARQLLLMAATVVTPLFMAAEAPGGIINTQNARIRVLMEDGFGNKVTNYGGVDGNEPGVGAATLDLNQGGFVAGANYANFGIFPGATTWNYNTTALNGGVDGAASTGGLTAGFNANFFGFALTQNILLSQFDPVGAPAKTGAARLRIDMVADFQNNAGAIAAGPPNLLGIWLNFFGNLPAVGDFAQAQVSVTLSNYLGGGGGSLTVNALTGGDAGGPGNFFYRSNGPTAGFFIDDITNTVNFPGVAANQLVRLEAHIDLLVDPGSIEFQDTNPNPVVPEPASGLGFLMLLGLMSFSRFTRSR